MVITDGMLARGPHFQGRKKWRNESFVPVGKDIVLIVARSLGGPWWDIPGHGVRIKCCLSRGEPWAGWEELALPDSDHCMSSFTKILSVQRLHAKSK